MLSKLYNCGLVSNSFGPAKEIRALRSYLLLGMALGAVDIRQGTLRRSYSCLD
jgi:hypothetical protein